MNWQDLVLTANFPAEISCEEISRSETRITLRWEKQPYDAPALCVTWKTALKDIQYECIPSVDATERCAPTGMHRFTPAFRPARRCSAFIMKKGRIG